MIVAVGGLGVILLGVVVLALACCKIAARADRVVGYYDDIHEPESHVHLRSVPFDQDA